MARVDNKPETLADLKPGDEVFVVYQQRRHSTSQQRTEKCVIARMGRQYGYLDIGRNNEAKFHLESGESWHKEWNCRANGFGFDVYLREEDWLESTRQTKERKRLKERLVDRFGWILERIPPAAIDKIHKVLDEEGVQ